MHFQPQRLCRMSGTAHDHIFLCDMIPHCLCEHIATAQNAPKVLILSAVCINIGYPPYGFIV